MGEAKEREARESERRATFRDRKDELRLEFLRGAANGSLTTIPGVAHDNALDRACFRIAEHEAAYADLLRRFEDATRPGRG